MKLAFISDIHANLPALKAVLNHSNQYRPDDTYCLGDLVNFAGWDNEVIHLLRSRGISCLQGNHDEGIGYKKKDFPYSFRNPSQKKFGLQSICQVNAHITEENRNYLKSLPFSIQLQFRFPFENVKIAMVHGSPVSNEDYILPDTPDQSLRELLDEAGADVLIIGHTHIPFFRSIFCEEENHKVYRHIINAGSVGKPKHGNAFSCYTIVEFNESLRLSDPASISVHFHYVPYDTKKVIKHIHDSGLGTAYDAFLKVGEQ